ncbi:MAG: hypothetical protein UX23_C0009G0010 [Parcubacteria group bacterium GW2011_GWB1_45_9]|nr:MAG: hypothetical protein UX23_C0009G0010 [Parcubacteria group bacterium GW2011_GWB1_45_9]
MKNIFKFLKIVLTDYKNAAMLAPTSKYATEKIVKAFGPNVKTVIEYGPGNGVITRKILSILPEDGRLIAVEIKPEFIEYLKKINDPRLEVMRDDILEIGRSLPKADVVVSGIPFSFFPQEKKKDIVRLTAEILKDNGVFIPYQYSLALRKILRKFFGEIKWSVEIRNFPTIVFIMAAKKPKKHDGMQID